VQKIYHGLGGIQAPYALNLRAWDIQYNGIAVELDEELHFNQYRAQTLTAPIYSSLPRFPLQLYQKYCTNHEHACLKAGRFGQKWTNPSCERQFGSASPNGILAKNGAPRWKQRAFYDCIKDLAPLMLGINVVRIAIWDIIVVDNRQIPIQKALDTPDKQIRDAIIKLIEQRSYLNFPI